MIRDEYLIYWEVTFELTFFRGQKKGGHNGPPF